MKPATVANVGPDRGEFTVEAIGSSDGAMGHMPQSSEL